MLGCPPLPSHVDSVLDVGCGIRPQSLVHADRYVGVDAHQPYLDRLNSHSGTFICSHWRPALKRFGRNEFELLTALDFIEHLPRADGHEFLRCAQRVAQRVLIFTPLGPFPQHYQAGELDQWGMDGGSWQTHRSAWTPADFLDWTVSVCHDFHRTDANGAPLPAPIGAFWALTTGGT